MNRYSDGIAAHVCVNVIELAAGPCFTRYAPSGLWTATCSAPADCHVNVNSTCTPGCGQAPQFGWLASTTSSMRGPVGAVVEGAVAAGWVVGDGAGVGAGDGEGAGEGAGAGRTGGEGGDAAVPTVVSTTVSTAVLDGATGWLPSTLLATTASPSAAPVTVGTGVAVAAGATPGVAVAQPPTDTSDATASVTRTIRVIAGSHVEVHGGAEGAAFGNRMEGE